MILAAAIPHHLTWVQAIVIGLFQGVTELFPVSSLGHSVLIPELFGWHNLVKSQDASESFFLAFIVGLHVANALALLVFFWRDWVRIIRAFFATLGKRRIDNSSERLAWLIIVASIPTGILGLVLEHKVRTLLAKPMSAAIFLMVNGLILFAGERLRRRSVAATEARAAASGGPAGGNVPTGDADVRRVVGRAASRNLDTMTMVEAGTIGLFQSLALIAGISRDGTAMVAGLGRGLDHEDAAKFAFLLATPIILAAGLFKVHDLFGSNGSGVGGQVLVGSVVTFFASLLTVRFLSRYFRTRTLTPFAIYSLVFGGFMAIFVAAGG